MSRKSLIAVVLFAASLAPALAQDAPREVPPNTQDVAPPRGTPPALATPQELIGKSVHDLRNGDIGAAARDDIKALRRGPLLIHGNYCGIGNRPGATPVDELDAACMRHDACTHTGSVPGCRCDDRLRTEAAEIAQDPSTRPDIRAIAAATAAGMAVLICK